MHIFVRNNCKFVRLVAHKILASVQPCSSTFGGTVGVDRENMIVVVGPFPFVSLL